MTDDDEGKLIEASWLSWSRKALPANTSPAKLKALRMAFFFGARHLFDALCIEAEEDETEEEYRHKIDLLEKELLDFLSPWLKNPVH